jgi:glycosyltransferase involved in cell wall biosynthesis
VKRVAFLTERMRLGFGTDLCIHEVASRMVGRFDVRVFTSIDDGTYRDRGYEILRYPTPHAALGWDYERWARRNADTLLPHRLDVAIPVTFPFFGVPTRVGIPSIVYDFGVIPSRGLRPRDRAFVEYMRLTNHWWHRRAAAVVTCSEFLKQTFARGAQRKTRVIPLGVDHVLPDTPMPSRNELRHHRGIGGDDVVLAFVGRLDVGTPYKGIADLVDIFQRLHLENERIRLLMRGFGTEYDEARLHFQGIDVQANAPLGELREVLHLADVYVTATRWEGFDLPLAEAQAMGVPCVAYDVGAHAEVVTTGGFLVRTQDEFVGRVLELARDAAARRRMGEAAREWARRFRWDRTAAALGDVVDTVAA